MTKEEILELSSSDRLEEMTLHPFAINAQVCKEHLRPIIYEGLYCPYCESMEEVDMKDKEIGQLTADRDEWENQFVDMEQERDDLQQEFEALEVEKDELAEKVSYFEEHCPEADI